MNKEAMYKLSYGLFVLTAKEGKKDNGCIINTAIQAASVPNQLSICINKANATHDMIVNTGKFTVSVLSQAADFELFKRFGFQSGRDVDKFEGYEACRRGENGIYYVTEGTNAYISAKADHMIDLGSHTMFIGEFHSQVAGCPQSGPSRNGNGNVLPGFPFLSAAYQRTVRSVCLRNAAR